MAIFVSVRVSHGEDAAQKHYVFQEAEEFTVLTGDWEAKEWGTNYYAASFANSFLSRQRYLGAPEQGEYAEATAEVTVPDDGTYHVCIRYEAAYNFETQFGLRIEQNGQEVFRRFYGAMENPKLWAFRQKVKPQVRWGWGPVENIVWEGTEITTTLKKGPAKLILFKDVQPRPSARRNVDVIMLTTDTAEIQKRIESENYLPLDGLLTQEGDLFLKIKNPDDAKVPITLLSPSAHQHSPYWVHIRNWPVRRWIDKNGASTKRPREPAWLAPGEESPWFDLGAAMDSLNVSGYFPQVQYPKEAQGKGIDVEFTFAVPGDGGTKKVIRQIRYTEPTQNVARFSVPGNVRYTRKIETIEEILDGLLKTISKFPRRGKLPRQILFYNTFHPGSGNSRVDELSLDICLALGNNVVNGMPGWIDPGLARSRGLGFKQTSKMDVRSVGTEKLKQWATDLRKKGQWAYIKVISLGDEIYLSGPKPGPETDVAFRAYLQNEGFEPSQILTDDPKFKELHRDQLWQEITYKLDTRETNPRLFYHGMKFRDQYGIDRLKERTDILEKRLPEGALIGANYSPHPFYWPHYGQWISVFRERAMTMPWSEDYLWQIAVTSQQVLGYIVSAFRNAARKHDLPIYMYVMPHTPGNTPASFRRAFYADVAHGAKYFDFFSPVPTAISYTENNMLPESIDMYHAIYDVIRDAGTFEDIVFPGRVRPAQVGILLSETTDIWNRSALLNAERQHLYMALKHAQFPVDIVSEDDLIEDNLGSCRILYLAVSHLSLKASRKLRKWVRSGGYVFATAAAGLMDEYGRPNTEMQKLLGVSHAGEEIFEGRFWGKDNLPRLEKLDTIHYKLSFSADLASLDVLLMKSILRPSRPPLLYRLTGGGNKVDTLGVFEDSTPALFERKYGSGKAVTCAAFPGTAYVKPAIPDRPCDRGSTDEAFTHFLPSAFKETDKAFISHWALDAGVSRPIITDNDLVETSWIESPRGIAIPLINYRGEPIESLEVKVLGAGLIRHVSSVTHGKLEFEIKDDELKVKLPLDVADMILLRRNPPRN